MILYKYIYVGEEGVTHHTKAYTSNSREGNLIFLFVTSKDLLNLHLPLKIHL